MRNCLGIFVLMLFLLMSNILYVSAGELPSLPDLSGITGSLGGVYDNANLLSYTDESILQIKLRNLNTDYNGVKIIVYTSKDMGGLTQEQIATNVWNTLNLSKIGNPDLNIILFCFTDQEIGFVEGSKDGQISKEIKDKINDILKESFSRGDFNGGFKASLDYFKTLAFEPISGAKLNWFLCKNEGNVEVCVKDKIECREIIKGFDSLGNCENSRGAARRIVFVPVNQNYSDVEFEMNFEARIFQDITGSNAEFVYLTETCSIPSLEKDKVENKDHEEDLIFDVAREIDCSELLGPINPEDTVSVSETDSGEVENNNSNTLPSSDLKTIDEILIDCAKSELKDIRQSDIFVGFVVKDSFANPAYTTKDGNFIFIERGYSDYFSLLAHEFGHLAFNYCDEYIFARHTTKKDYECTDQMTDNILAYSQRISPIIRANIGRSESPSSLLKNWHFEAGPKKELYPLWINLTGSLGEFNLSYLITDIGNNKVNVKFYRQYNYGWDLENKISGCANPYPLCCSDNPDKTESAIKFLGENCVPEILFLEDPMVITGLCIGGPCYSAEDEDCRSIMGPLMGKQREDSISRGMPT